MYRIIVEQRVLIFKTFIINFRRVRRCSKTKILQVFILHENIMKINETKNSTEID